ncbi:MAG TPA: glucoamylase family protein [Lentimicrobium sp.]|nr:glucoamylase family protein [Lentimicrobium sp.]
MKNLTLFRIFLLFSIIISFGFSRAQTYLYFQDSPTPVLYDYSWMELTAPSQLERVGAELRRFPVETEIEAAQGLNSLRLKWKSASGGGWFAIAAGLNWTEKDLTDTDTLHFMLYSFEGISKSNLPLVFMEDVNNQKTTFHNFSSYTTDLAAGVWTRITIPMNIFLEAGDAVDFTKIKTIGFTQGVADNIQHTLLIDDMRVFKGSGVSPIASVPTGVQATGYDSHIEILWHKNPEPDLNGYQVQRSTDGGLTFHTAGLVTATDTGYIDWVADFGYDSTLVYRVASLNPSNQLSEYSDTTAAATREFTDDELLQMVQQYTFRYFYDFAHPVSGLARERNTSGDVVTIGGSGFGIMALLVGIERGFITRQQGIDRLLKITGFLETADRFHGAWPHWMDGNTGNVIPFSPDDNGGDLVETAFLAQGILTARQYFNSEDSLETILRDRLTQLWETIEWDWYDKNNSNVLYWHWSPNYGWAINMQVRGWNEAAIVYILGVASPTYSVNGSLWQSGWAAGYENGGTFYGYKLDIGWDYGGPLFFAHYSFQGFDPRNIKDQYTNYFNLNRNHTLIHRAYAIDNPKNHPGYGENAWGFTASDDPNGYQVHEPTASRDNGTLTPTAALSSMPYTPVESLNALKYFYREKGEKIWGRMGFFDAYNERVNWYADSYLAIDQGPIINMIENYRSELLWDNFMSNPEIAPALTEIGFVADPFGLPEKPNNSGDIAIWPNPSSEAIHINLISPESGDIELIVTDMSGRVVIIQKNHAVSGSNNLILNADGLMSGIYILKITCNHQIIASSKLIVKEK